ncbi:cathepsin L2-like [Notamacropus eugenii]|uniref:cathepsin L2-like n=1 Tax=Notamacropus eugenii TaxID=9315 RepID=UPI003B66D259
MNFYLCLASLCLGLAAAAPQFDRTLDAKWEQWKSQHGRTYGGTEEDNWRRATWEKNLKMIEMHNLEYSAGKHSFRMEMNNFGDMSSEEFRQMMNGFTEKSFQGKTKGTLFREPLFEQIPKSVDWRDKGYVTPVKDELSPNVPCYASWAFSATGSLEGQWFRKTGKLISLSEQNLIDCARHKGNYGCKGGFVSSAFEYVKKNGGIDPEESYPYERKDGNCRYRAETAIANVTGYVYIPSENETALQMAVATVGPISVTIDASHTSFRFYESGVYHDQLCSSHNPNHAMLVVGYGADEKTKRKYWIVKNSFNTTWGMKGYVLVAKDEYNHCGIATEACYPEV